MYGNHDYETAKQIADQKTAESGQQHAVFPTDDGKWTIGVPIRGLSGEEFRERLRARARKEKESDEGVVR